MKKSFKIILSAMLALVMLISVGTVAFAEDEETNVTEGSLSVISANVAGLPIPSKFSDDGKVVPKTQKIIGQLLNESGIDIICVQEDFQYHAILAAQMTNYPYQTYTSGGVPAGDGLNIYSKYPIYNIERVEWEVYDGILDELNDGLTPKGFMKCTVDYNGILIDLYDVHSDAGGSLSGSAARHAQNEQLAAYIDENSADRPVIITGDMNVYTHTQHGTGIYEIFIAGEGFDEAWTMFCHDGVYFEHDVTWEERQELEKIYGGDPWGRWDSAEKLLYRGNSSVGFEVTEFRYDDYNELAGQAVSDHNMMVCELKVTATDYVRPEIELNEQQKEPLADRIVRTIKLTARCIYRILTDLVAKIKSGEITFPTK